MAYSATLANLRGILSDADHQRILNLFSRAGLSMDHHDFNEDILDKGTKAILRTRDGKLRAAVPSPLGKCVFLNDVSMDEMYTALRHHKSIMKQYPRNGEGLEAYVDASDTGYTVNGEPVEMNGSSSSNGHLQAKVLNDDAGQHRNGTVANGHVNVDCKATNGVAKAIKHASGPEGVDGLQNGAVDVAPPNGHANGNGNVNGMNGHSNGVHANGVH
jgi:3-dehydroquinate synthase